MKEKLILKKLNKEINMIVPNIIDEIRTKSIIKEKKNISSRSIFPKLAISFATFILVIVAMFVISHTASDYTNYVYIDINPSIEFIIKDDLVTEARALNNDGVVVLVEEEFIGMEIVAATEKVIYIANDLGYVTASTNEINISLINNNQEKENELSTRLQSEVANYLSSQDIDATVVAAIEEGLADEAAEYGISIGKLMFIKRYIEERPEFNINQLKNNKISILKEDLMNYNENDIGEYRETIHNSIRTYYEEESNTYNRFVTAKNKILILKALLDEYTENPRQGIINQINNQRTIFNSLVTVERRIVNTTDNIDLLTVEVENLSELVNILLDESRAIMAARIMEIKKILIQP